MAATEGRHGSRVSTNETAEMERSVAALALELPAEVWDDVRARWHAARDSLGAEIDRLRSEARKEAEFVRNLTGDNGEPALLESGYPELTAALDRMEAGWR